MNKILMQNSHYTTDFMVEISDILEPFRDLRKDKLQRFEFYRPYPVFQDFHRIGNKASIRLLLAANRIGKTYSCLAEFAMHATATYPDDWEGYKYTKKNLTLWAGGISGVEADDIVERLFEGDGDDAPPLIHESLLIYQNKKTRYYKVTRANGGIANIRIKTYGVGEKKNKHSTWKARHVDCIFLDEEPTMSVFMECCIRITNIKSKDHGMIMIAATCTQFSEFVLRFTQRVDRIVKKVGDREIVEEKQVNICEGEICDGRVYLLAGLDDAHHLTEDVKKRMISNMLPQEIEARTKGMPSIGSGMVYPVLEELITCEAFDIPDHYARIIGMDFGWSDPTALIFGALDRDTGVLYITFEYSMSGKTPDSHLADLQTMNLADSLWWSPVMGDPAGQASSQKDGESLFNIYKEKGLNLRKADNARSAGILTCLQMMLDGKLKIFKSRCPKLLNEIRTYAYDSKGRIVDGNDHLLDAMRYMIMGIGYAETKTYRRAHYEESSDFSYMFGE